MMKKILFVFLPLLAFYSLFATSEKPIIVFDYGGVLATVDKSEVQTFIQERLALSSQQVRDLHRLVRKRRKKVKNEELAWKKACREKNIVLPERWAQELEEKQLSVVQKRPHMMELVAALKKEGYQVAMLSNISRREALLVKKLGFYEPFDPILLSHEIGVSKPKALAFEILVKKLGVPPGKIIFIDDQQQNIDVAKKLGIDAIRFVSFEKLEKELKLRNLDFATFLRPSSGRAPPILNLILREGLN